MPNCSPILSGFLTVYVRYLDFVPGLALVSCMSREVSREESLEVECQEVLLGLDLREVTRLLIRPCRECRHMNTRATPTRM